MPPATGAVIATGAGWELTDEEFAALVDFSASAMQRSFVAPVAVELMGPSGVSDLREGLEYITPTQWEVMRALGLVRDQDSLELVNEIRNERVRGTCCATTDGVITVQVEDTGFESLTSYVIVHELVHALLTQSPPQGVLPDSAFDEPVDVVAGASEGVPQWVAVGYHETLTPAEQEAISGELPIIREADLEAGVPDAAAELLTFGYVRGPDLVDGVGEAGVERPYDAVLDRFPGTSEQVLFPDAYVEEESPTAPVELPAVPSGSLETGAGRLGSLLLMLTIEPLVGEVAASQLVRPWAGDAYVLWSDGDRACIAVELAMDDANSTEALANVLADWAVGRPSASLESDGTSIGLSSCSS
jgi:hypothetical protein